MSLPPVARLDSTVLEYGKAHAAQLGAAVGRL
jgi:hypothetical protein